MQPPSLSGASPLVKCFEAQMLQDIVTEEHRSSMCTAARQIGSSLSHERVSGLRRALALMVELATDDCGEASMRRRECIPRISTVLSTNFVTWVFVAIFPRPPTFLPSAPEPPRDPQHWSTLSSDVSGGSPKDRALRALVDVTYTEQEMALRFLQGLCVLSPTQQSYVVESPLVPMVVEWMRSCRAHLLSTHGSMEGRRELVLIAAADAIEAACRCNPPCLELFVQCEGVAALLDVAALSIAPMDLRCTIVDVFSVLMQQCAPPNEDQPYLQEWRVSATKFDHAVRSWFLEHHQPTLMKSLVALRDVRGTAVPAGTPKSEVQRVLLTLQRHRERLFATFFHRLDSDR